MVMETRQNVYYILNDCYFYMEAEQVLDYLLCNHDIICNQLLMIVVFFQAKKFVESTPQMIKSNLLKEEAEKLRNEIIEAGGFAEIE